MIINLDNAVRQRESGGVRWLHVRCPICPSRCGPDTKQKLGVGFTAKGAVINCFRCGAKARDFPSDTRFLLRGSSLGLRDLKLRPEAIIEKGEDGLSGYDALPGTPLAELPACVAGRVMEAVDGRWSLSLRSLAGAGLRIGAMPSRLYLPYWTPRGWGYIDRDLSRDSKPMLRGPKGVAFLRELPIGQKLQWVVVEAWADAVAVPPPWTPAILNGTSNWPDMRGPITFALDNDGPGRAAMRKKIVACLKAGKEVWVADYRGDDPADAGVGEMSRALANRWEIKGLMELMEWVG